MNGRRCLNGQILNDKQLFLEIGLCAFLNSKETGITSWVQIRLRCFQGIAFFLSQYSVAEISSKGMGHFG